MNSSTQKKITPVSGMEPSVISRGDRRSSRFKADVEQALCEAITEFYASPEPQKWPWAYRAYWLSCRAANLGHVSPLQFFQRLQQEHPSVVAVPRGSHFMAVVQIDQMTFDFSLVGGASS